MEGETKQNIDKLIGDLRKVVTLNCEIEENGAANIVQILDSLVNVSKTSIEDATEFVIDDIFLILLKHKSKEIIAKTAKAIAEISKTETGREKCTNLGLVKVLMDLLKEDDIDILTQTSRALGNICYENENGRKLIKEEDGLKLVLNVLKKGIDLRDMEGASFLRNVAAGFLLNFFVDHQALQKQALEAGAVSIICSILEIDGTAGREAATHALLTLGVLNDAGVAFLDEKLTRILVDILGSDTSSELSEMCLELLHGQAEDEQSKLLLAKAGVCELLLKLLEKHGPHCTDEDTRSVLKVACNLIVLILTGDDSMNMLYDGSNGMVYKKLVEWLENGDEDLQVTAVLAMGNFARSDTHCKLMVSQGIHRKLLKLLKQNDSKDGDIRFQHALLSALRNLVIPAENKSIILKDGLIDILYPMLDIPTFPVVFKLLGTIRIVIDGQKEAAIALGKRDDLIKRSVEWCKTEDHPGVQGEANRLIAWLIHNSRDKDVLLSVIQHEAVKHLVKMMMAPHTLMQHEAILSLTILSSICLSEAEPVLKDAEIGQMLSTFFKENASTLDEPILCNALSFVENIINSDELREHLKQSLLPIALKEAFESRESNDDLRKRVDKLLASITNAN